MSVNHPPKMTGTKTCSRCKIEQHVMCFAINHKQRDGLHSYCRKCEVEITKRTPSYKARRQKVANKRLGFTKQPF